MNKISVLPKSFFFFLILLLTFISISRFSVVHYSNLWAEWIVKFTIICFIIKYKSLLFPVNLSYKLLNIYLVWTAFCILRGIFIAENYLEYKQLIDNGMSLFIPLFLWVFCKPTITQYIYRKWYIYALLSFVLVFYWIVGHFLEFYFAPLLLLFCYFTLFRKKYSLLILIAAMFFVFMEIENVRSQAIKGGIAILIGIIAIYAQKISPKLLRLGHAICYFSSVVLFLTVLSDASGLIFGNLSENEAIQNNKDRTNLSKDTRSLIYYDVIQSAIDHDYWLLGHTPARGNEINASGILYLSQYDDSIHFNKNERARNEILHLNIFTWEGIIGLILYSLLYMRASFLAVYKSKNCYLPLLGCYVAFRWSFGWVQDTNTFSIQDVALWSMIAMCYSPYFRNMSNVDFKFWIRSLISKK